MSKISANQCAGWHVRFNAIMSTYTSRQPEDMNSVHDLGCVVEDAAERNSWGKSRSDRMCHFPNTGGLHRISGDAPFETQNFTCNNNTEMSHIATTAFYANRNINRQSWAISEVMGRMGQSLHPSWCYVNKSYNPLLRRTQVTACAYRDKSHKSASWMMKHKRCTNTNQKHYKQGKYLKDVQVCNVASNRKVQFMTSDSIRRNIVVCDGGDMTDDAIQPISSCSGTYCLCIRDGDLWFADAINASLSLCFIWPGETSPVFIRLPRNESLGIMNDGKSICSAIRSYASTQ